MLASKSDTIDIKFKIKSCFFQIKLLSNQASFKSWHPPSFKIESQCLWLHSNRSAKALMSSQTEAPRLRWESWDLKTLSVQPRLNGMPSGLADRKDAMLMAEGKEGSEVKGDVKYQLWWMLTLISVALVQASKAKCDLWSAWNQTPQPPKDSRSLGQGWSQMWWKTMLIWSLKVQGRSETSTLHCASWSWVQEGASDLSSVICHYNIPFIRVRWVKSELKCDGR